MTRQTQVSRIKRPLALELITKGGFDRNDMSHVAVHAIGDQRPSDALPRQARGAQGGSGMRRGQRQRYIQRGGHQSSPQPAARAAW